MKPDEERLAKIISKSTLWNLGADSHQALSELVISILQWHKEARLKWFGGVIPKKKWLKDWFEANYLDGDEIQRGQMIASSECFGIILEVLQELTRRTRG